MTQEDKFLLLKDLCARLPYGVRVKFRSYVDICEIKSIDITKIDYYPITLDNCFEQGANINEVKPYLRPMSSMTEEEKKEYHFYCDNYYGIYFDTVKSIDYLNSQHLDYRGLIPKELAIEVTEENNPYR